MRRIVLLGVTLCMIAGTATAKPKEVLPYKNPALSIDERVADLLGRMTIEEKVGQLRCTMAWNYISTKTGKKTKTVELTESFKKDMTEGHIGMLWATYRADPWTQKSL